MRRRSYRAKSITAPIRPRMLGVIYSGIANGLIIRPTRLLARVQPDGETSVDYTFEKNRPFDGSVFRIAAVIG